MARHVSAAAAAEAGQRQLRRVPKSLVYRYEKRLVRLAVPYAFDTVFSPRTEDNPVTAARYIRQLLWHLAYQIHDGVEQVKFSDSAYLGRPLPIVTEDPREHRYVCQPPDYKLFSTSRGGTYIGVRKPLSQFPKVYRWPMCECPVPDPIQTILEDLSTIQRSHRQDPEWATARKAKSKVDRLMKGYKGRRISLVKEGEDCSVKNVQQGKPCGHTYDDTTNRRHQAILARDDLVSTGDYLDAFLNEFLEADTIQKVPTHESYERSRGHYAFNVPRADSATLSTLMADYTQEPTALHIRGGTGTSEELSSHLYGLDETTVSQSVGPVVRGGGLLERTFIPRKGGRRDHLLNLNRPQLGTEQSNDPNSASIDLRGSIYSEAASARDSYVSSYTSDHDRFTKQVRDTSNDVLTKFPSPPTSPTKAQPTGVQQRRPSSPKWNSESETEIASRKPLALKTSVNSDPKTGAEPDWDSEMETPKARNQLGQPTTTLRNDRPAADTAHPGRPDTARDPTTASKRRPYPPSLMSLENPSDWEREPRLDNPVFTPPRIRPSPPFAAPPSSLQYADLRSPPKTFHVGPPNDPLNESPEQGIVSGISLMKPEGIALLGLQDPFGPSQSDKPFVYTGKYNVPDIQRRYKNTDLGSPSEARHRHLELRKRVEPMPEDDEGSMMGAGTPALGGTTTRNEAVPGRTDTRNQGGSVVGNPASIRPARSNIGGHGSDIMSQVTARIPNFPPSEAPFQSVSEKGGFQGQLAEEGRLSSVHEWSEAMTVHELSQQERMAKLAAYKRQQDDWKQKQDRLRAEYLQAMKDTEGHQGGVDAEFEVQWKSRAYALGAEDADITRMIQEAAARLIAEQQQKPDKKSTLRRLGSRCNRTLKLMLAIPSSPELKTSSSTRPRSPPRQMSLPLGALGGALSAQRRIPQHGSMRSRPSTAASRAQKSEGSRRHSVASGQALSAAGRPVISYPILEGQSGGMVYSPNTRKKYEEAEESAMFREAERSLSSIFGAEASAVSGGEGTVMPTQEQMGNLKWRTQKEGGVGGAQNGGQTTSRQMMPGQPMAGHALGQTVPGRAMPHTVPRPRYVPSFKSTDTTVLPTQSQVYGKEF